MTEAKTIMEKEIEQKCELESLKEKVRMKEKKKKRERNAVIIFVVFALALLIGYAIGIQHGYHSALVDFSIIPGKILPPY